MTTTRKPTEIYSTFGGDPDLGELVELFVAEMPQRIATLEQCFSDGDLESLRRTAHQMKGAAGSYGFEQLTPFAKAVEYAVRDDEPEEQIQGLLQELVNVCQQVRAGQPN